MDTLKLTNDYRPHSNYQASGVDWLGEIPRDWVVWKVSRAFSSIGSGGTPPTAQLSYYDDGDINWLITGDLNNGEITETSKKISNKALVELNMRIFPKGSIVIAMYGATIGKVGLLRIASTTNQACCVLEPSKKLNNRFALYWFLGNQKALIDQAYGGGQPNISQQIIQKFKILTPSLIEQQKIVDFLDQKTQLINKIIAKKQKLIELLKERRRAIIHHTISSTTGVSERLKFSVGFNPSKKASRIYSQDSQVAFLPMEAVSELGEIEPETKSLSEVDEGFTFFANGDVILAKITPCFENGKAAEIRDLPSEIGFGSTEYIVMRPIKGKLISRYLYYLIFSDQFRKTGEVEMRGSAGQKRVPEAYVSNYMWLRPTLSHQTDVIKNLDLVAARIGEALVKVERSIEKLVEFKQSLISQVVTGKVKV